MTLRCYSYFLCILSYHPQIFVHCRPTQTANSCQLTHIHLARDKCRIVLVEDCGNVILCGLRSADLAVLLLCIPNSAADSGSDDGKLQLCKHSRHLNEGLAHGINVAFSAVDHNAAYNLQPHVLALDDVHNLTELLGAAAQSRHFAAYEGTFNRFIQLILLSSLL